jgi:predicted TIM-barrel fold metal-dependent hydrolase
MRSRSRFQRSRASWWTALLLCLLFAGCRGAEDGAFEILRGQLDRIRVIDAHEHQRWPAEFEGQEYNFYTLLSYSYMQADMVSAGGPRLEPEAVNRGDLAALWDMHGPYLDACRNTTYYSHFLAGFRLLYGYEEPHFSREGIARLSEEIRANYSRRDSWFEDAFRRAGFEIMFVDQYWDALNDVLDTRYFALVLNVNPLISGIAERSRLLLQEAPARGNVYRWAEQQGLSIRTLEEYLAAAEAVFERFQDQGVVCLKNSSAYWRSLAYEDVASERAQELFGRPEAELTPDEKKELQDFMFHWIIQKAVELDLPIQIHTGYLAGNGNVLENSHPLLLNNLFLKYRKARFVLFHGGYPWTGEYAAMGKMFPNVFLDIVWLPQISREAAVRSLDEMLDTVPSNKFFWGGDCHFIEESAGSLAFGKDVVARVLAARVRRGLMTEETALEVARGIFRDNAIRVFKLKEEPWP